MSENPKEDTFTKGPLTLSLQKRGARELFIFGTPPCEFFGTEWHLAYNIPAALGVKDDTAAVTGGDRTWSVTKRKACGENPVFHQHMQLLTEMAEQVTFLFGKDNDPPKMRPQLAPLE